MSLLPATSVGTRATSSGYDLKNLTHRLGGQPRDNESQPQDPANDPEAKLREDTRGLAELLDRPGVDGALIADLLGYGVEDHVNHDQRDPNNVARSKIDEANLDRAIHESERTRTPSRRLPQATTSRHQSSSEQTHAPSRGHPRETTSRQRSGNVRGRSTSRS